MKVVLIFILVLWTVNTQNAHFDLVLLDEPSAVCLDGSPGAYYYSIG